MDFFKSVFSDDPQASESETTTTSQSPPSSNSNPNSNPEISTSTNAWTFGSSLFKNLASKSDSLIETYRRDLENFNSELKKETQIIRQAASRAVHDLPSRLESGAALAVDRLESVGQAVDHLGSAVSELINQGKSSILDSNSDSDNNSSNDFNNLRKLNLNLKPYSRVEEMIRSIQSDVRTYCEEVDNLEEYKEWEIGFELEEKSEEIEDLIEENGIIGGIYNEVVPSLVDRETFWARYFYRVYRVKKGEEARVRLMKRAVSGEEEEELSWDVDDEDDDNTDEESGGSKSKSVLERGTEEISVLEKNVGELGIENKEEGSVGDNDDKVGMWVPTSDGVDDEKGELEGGLNESELSGDKMGEKSDDKVSLEAKNDNSDFSVVSSQPSSHEEDLGWDEIEDMGSSDESKVAGPARWSPNITDLRKLMSAADEDEDLTWDIEDDEEPVKS